MSRVAKAPILLPDNVELSVGDGTVTVKGPKGTITKHCNKNVSITTDTDNSKLVVFKPATKDVNAWAYAGTVRAIVHNMVVGVTVGFQKTLELVGVGYRANSKGSSVTLSLGFSHNIEHVLPKGVEAVTPNVTTLILSCMDNQLLGQVAAEIRAYRPPEPYKGKGVKYAGEQIVRKEAKKK